jgi:hypothetical protein
MGGRWGFLKWVLIGAVFLATRLVNLSQMAIFSDEALYLRWVQVMHQQEFWEEPFISLRDGKEPLHPWFLYLVYPLFEDPVVAGRMVSVLAGLGTVVMVWLLARELFGRDDKDDKQSLSLRDKQSLSLRDKGNRGDNVAFWAMLVYVVLPMPLVHDRLAVIDSLLSLTCVVTMWGLVRLVKSDLPSSRLGGTLARQASFGRAGVAGVGLGLALLTKSIARVWLPLVVVTPFLFRTRREINNRDSSPAKRSLNDVWEKLKWVGVVLVVAGIVNLPFWLHEDFSKVVGKNAIFLYTLPEWLGDPVGIVWRNLSLTLRWMGEYHGWPLAVFVAGVVLYWVIRLIKKRRKVGGDVDSENEGVRMLWLGAWIAWPVLVNMLVAKIYFPRYFLFTSIPMVAVAGWGISHITYHIAHNKLKYRLFRTVLYLGFLAVLLGWPGWLSFQIVRNIEVASLPAIERWQYLESWPAGYGLKEAVEFLRGYYFVDARVAAFIGGRGEY